MRWQVLMAAVGIAVVLALLGVTSTTVEVVVEPEPGGTFIEGVPDYPTTFNPLYAQSDNAAEQDVLALVFNSLTRADETGNLVPDLAERWTISNDSSTYTFFLRRDVLWHDGAPFTADDVAYTVSVIQDPAFLGTVPAAELWREVTVEVVTPYTIRFILPEEVIPFAPFLSYTTFSILPAHLLAGYPVAELPQATLFPVGTGKWRVTNLTGTESGIEMVLEPNPVWKWESEPPMLEELVLRFYENVEQAVAALNRNEVMGVGNVPPSTLPSILTNEELTPNASLTSGYTALFFNLRNPLFESRDVREALTIGLDRQELINDVLEGQGVVANGFLMPTHWANPGDLPPYPYNREAAEAALESAGWIYNEEEDARERGGQPVEFTILTIASDPVLEAVAAEISRQYAELGLQVTPEAVNSLSELRTVLQTGDFDMFILSTPSNGLPPDPDFFPLWHSSQIGENRQNYTSFNTAEADLLLVEGRATLDQNERRAIYAEFQQILARELPAIPLYHPITNYVVSSLVKEVQVGPSVHPGDRFESLPEWYIRTRRELRERTPVDSEP
jgi:peptide/nickel transport system substrate-binding protein